MLFDSKNQDQINLFEHFHKDFHKKKKIYTELFVVKDNKVILATKKRGFLAGRLFGYGGKVDKNESI